MTSTGDDTPPVGLHWALAIEAGLILLALAFGFVPAWRLDGERHTGVVISVEPRDESHPTVTIREPETELTYSVIPEFWDPEVGDIGTVLVSPTDPSKVGTVEDVTVYLVLWSLLPLAAIAWPFVWWVALRNRPRLVMAPIEIDLLGSQRRQI